MLRWLTARVRKRVDAFACKRVDAFARKRIDAFARKRIFHVISATVLRARHRKARTISTPFNVQAEAQERSACEVPLSSLPGAQRLETMCDPGGAGRNAHLGQLYR